MDAFCYDIISNLVKYIDANIGALFIVNDYNSKDIHYELAAAYAYDRRKYFDKRVELGEGLVGRCAQEKETIFITELPQGYIQISSGLGYENPSSLLIVPLKLNDVVYGVVEIASIDIMEKHIVEFVERVSDSIATTISTIKINLRTVKLLEESRVKSEDLASQEEEMRQNIEELQATQEEAARKSAEMTSLIKAINASNMVIEYDTKGKILAANEQYLKLTNQTEEEVIGTHHADKMVFDDKQQSEYNHFWENLRNGIIMKQTTKVELHNKIFTFIETYSPIFDEGGRVLKIIKLAQNITDFVDDKVNE